MGWFEGGKCTYSSIFRGIDSARRFTSPPTGKAAVSFVKELMKEKSSMISFSHLKSVSRGSGGGAARGSAVRDSTVRVEVQGREKGTQTVIPMRIKVRMMRASVSAARISRPRVKTEERSGGIVVYWRVRLGRIPEKRRWER